MVNIKPLPLLIILAVLLFFYHDKQKIKEMHSTRVNELKDSIALYQKDIFKLDSILTILNLKIIDLNNQLYLKNTKLISIKNKRNVKNNHIIKYSTNDVKKFWTNRYQDSLRRN